jgi:hypothetical protein
MMCGKQVRSLLRAGVLLCTAVAVHAVSDPDSAPRKLTLNEARELANQPASAHGPVDLTESPRPLDRVFYYLAATWRNPTGSPVAGYYAVNPWTGDVWDVSGCKRLDSETLRKRRDAIRRESGVSRSAFARLRNRKPLCIWPDDR